MKKWISVLAVVVALCAAAIYLFIPAKLTISVVVPVKTSPAAALRVLNSNWRAWWPGNPEPDSTFTFRNFRYRIVRPMYQSFEVEIRHNNKLVPAEIILLPIRRDSFNIEWRARQQTGSSPISRIRNYVKANDLEKDLRFLLDSFSAYTRNTRNIYGCFIEETTVTDTIILVSTISTDTYPSVGAIYNAVAKLKTFASDHGVETSRPPMLNIDSSSSHYITRVGLPIEKELTTAGTQFSIKRMVRGYLLFTEVRGGPGTIRNAFVAIEQYLSDQKRGSPAIPYQSLISDRSTQPDTSKWTTRIYYPAY